jgi:hypothetical protein
MKTIPLLGLALALAACGASPTSQPTNGTTAAAQTPTPNQSSQVEEALTTQFTSSDETVNAVNCSRQSTSNEYLCSVTSTFTGTFTGPGGVDGQYVQNVTATLGAGGTVGWNSDGNATLISAAPSPTSTPAPTATPTSAPDGASYKASAAAISYPLLSKDPAALAGTVVTYEAQVFQYDTATTTSHFIASVTDDGYGVWTDNVWVDVQPSIAQQVCTGTILTFWGVVVGPHTYTTTLNGSVTIPEINVKYISVVSNGC